VRFSSLDARPFPKRSYGAEPLLTGIEGTSSRPVRRIVLRDG
jgi:hypothetical protein